MSVEITPHFGAIDYGLFAAMLLFSILIGVWASLKGNKSPEEFLMGNRSFGPIPISMSLLTSFVSSISILGFSGEAYAHGIQMSLFVFGTGLGITTAGLVILPVIFPLKLTSVNEYILLRFKSARLHSCISFLTCLQGLFYMGVCLYAPTIALVTVTKLNYLVYIFLLGFVCTIYASFGGIRAVVWTDVFQLSIMLIGLSIVNAIGCINNGGLVKTWSIASNRGRLDLYNMNPNIYVRHNFYNTIAFGFFLYSNMYGVSQINVQRMCSVNSIKDAYKILVINVFGMIGIYFLIFTGGLVAFATYSGCDPLALGIIIKKEQIMPHFIMDQLSYIPGLPGMFVATLVGGTMSSLSSVVSATVAMLWRDVCLKLEFFRNSSTSTAMLTNKVLSLIVGMVLIGLATLCSKSSSLIELTVTLGGVVLGPIYGVFLIGLLLPKCNIKGVWTGFIVSLIFVSWISIGALFHKEDAEVLSMSVDDCSNLHSMISNDTLISLVQAYREKENATIATEEEVENYHFTLKQLYKMSYTLYCIIGPLMCVIIAVIVSICTGGQRQSEVLPKYVSPFLRRFYWTKEELKYYEMKESKILNYGSENNLEMDGGFEAFAVRENDIKSL